VVHFFEQNIIFESPCYYTCSRTVLRPFDVFFGIDRRVRIKENFESLSIQYVKSQQNKSLVLNNCFTFHWLVHLICSDSELTSETMIPFRHFVMTPWMGERLIATSLPT